LLERFKLLVLLFLIALSLLQTYRLWFGRPLPEEGTLPRYEQAMFTDPPSTSRFIHPAQILVEKEESIYLFKPGEAEHAQLWEECFQIITGEYMEFEQISLVSEEEQENILENSEVMMELSFNYLIPQEIFSPETGALTDVETVFLLWKNDAFQVMLKGEETFIKRLPASQGNSIMEQLLELDGNGYQGLPQELDLFVFETDEQEKEFIFVETGEHLESDRLPSDLDEAVPADELELDEVEGTLDDAEGMENAAEDGDISAPGADTPVETPEEVSDEEASDQGFYDENEETSHAEGEEGAIASDGTGEEEDAVDVENEEEVKEEPEADWTIKVEGTFLLPENNLWAAERAVSREEIDVDQLVRAFFVDTSMARRIEERDKAVFFTDGEKGLRIYPSGRIEYTAPRLERVMSSVTYYNALQKGAEKLSLYGGWKPEVFLDKMERQTTGYRLTWQMFHEGLPLVGENLGSTMVLNEQGVSYYQRKFPVLGEPLLESRQFSPYEHALFKAIELEAEAFSDQKVTLLKMEPVYYLPAENEQKQAVPAWKIKFKETGPVYLHWQSLEPMQ